MELEVRVMMGDMVTQTLRLDYQGVVEEVQVQ
jgi:hypothetical protein